MSRAGVVVVGSANLDLVASVAAIPAPGETVLARAPRQEQPGGKGLNQAVAAARAGAATTFVGAVGRDPAADVLLGAAAAAGIDVGLVRRAAADTGTAWIMVQPDGENAIVVDSGANATLTTLTDAERAAVTGAAVVLLQLETPLEAVTETARAAHGAGVRVVLNAAPAQPLDDELLALVDVLVVNEHEDRSLGPAADRAAAVVVTLGAEGALIRADGGERRFPGVPADVVDTTGAGDTFTGYLVAALAAGAPLDEAVTRAVVAGSLAVEAAGAVPSIPTAGAVDARQARTPRPIDRPTAVPLDPGADLSALDEAKILAAPDDPADRPAWHAALLRWRDEARERVGYDPARYDDPAGAWAATAWNVAMVWLWDEAVRDWEADGGAGRFDADRLLAAYADVGGLDAVVLWHAYPVIGVDERSQFDWYAVPGLDALVGDLHAKGVRLFLDYNPWDVGTRRAPDGATDAARLAELVTGLGADGVFLDTLKEGDPDLLATLGALTPPPVLEGESRVPLVRIADHQASWAQWFADSPTPGVLRARWFEQRHTMHHTRRWSRDHGAELRSAWLNGAGVLLWDVAFGVRVDWTPRDRAALRLLRTTFGDHADLVVRGEWEPLTDLAPAATAAGLAGSRWSVGERALLTIAHAGSSPYTGPLIPHGPDVTVPVGGLVGVLPDGTVVQPEPAEATVVVPEPRRVVPTRVPGPPAADAVRPTPGKRDLPVTWRQRETGLYEPAAYVDDWKPLPPRLHQPRSGTRAVVLTPVAVDAREVTHADFSAHLRDTGRPDPRPQPGPDDAPVTGVDLDDARAYAAWRGARLPTEDEWQAAAGEDGWTRAAEPVWEWTESEHRDGRTRWSILKGGSPWAAEGSDWYVDGGVRDPSWSVRYLLTGGGTSRSERIGFRCAVDLPS